MISAATHIARLVRAAYVFAREGVFGVVDPAGYDLITGVQSVEGGKTAVVSTINRNTETHQPAPRRQASTGPAP